MTVFYWTLAFVAMVLVLALILLAIDLGLQELAARREAKELQRRIAYPPKHYLNEDVETVVLPAAAVEAVRARLEVTA